MPGAGQFNPNIATIPNHSDRAGNFPFVSMFGDLVSGQRTDEIIVSFQFGISAYDVIYDANTTSDLSHAGGKAVLSSGSDTDPARMVSRLPLRYPAGHMAYALFSASWQNYGSGSAYAGPLCYDGGFFVGFHDGDFVVGRRKDGADELIYEDGMDYKIISDDPYLDFSLIPGNNNLFCVTYGDMAAAPATFWVLTNVGWIPFHTIRQENGSPDVPVGNPSVPIMFEVRGPGISISTRAFSGGFVGHDTAVNARPHGYKRTGVSVAGGATETIVVFRIPDTFKGAPNCTISELINYLFYVDAPALGSGTVEFEILANPTITVEGDFAPVEATESPIEYSINTTINQSTGMMRAYGPVHFASQGNVSATAPGNFDAMAAGLVGARGDVFALIARNTSTTTVTVRTALFWRDRI